MIFRTKRYTLDLSEPKVMAVINLTPDSFFDASRFDIKSAVAHAERACKAGAAIIDLGAQSTAPDSKPISESDELERLIEPLRAVRKAVDIPISVDTYYPAVAKAALENGADIINDVSGKADGVMSAVAVKYGAGHIIMHTGGLQSNAARRDSTDIITLVNRFFECSVRAAAKAGLKRESICLDPGIGFGKSREDDLRIISHYSHLETLGCAALVGLSRKRVTRLCGDALTGTVIANAECIFSGADIIRVHDVEQGIATVKMAALLTKGTDNG